MAIVMLSELSLKSISNQGLILKFLDTGTIVLRNILNANYEYVIIKEISETTPNLIVYIFTICPLTKLCFLMDVPDIQ